MTKMRNVLITGASGFVGSALVDALSLQRIYELTGVYRQTRQDTRLKVLHLPVITGDTDWSNALNGQNVVIHTAGRAHVMEENHFEALSRYRDVNVAVTLNLARQAAAAGVERFIFLSSIKVNGETSKQTRISFSDEAAFSDPYGQSKFEAEEGLREISSHTKMEVVIIRPPLIYGRGVKGNFRSLLNIVQKPIPLPFASIQNKRSFLNLDNLIDFILITISHPKAANQTFLISDDHDISTAELLKKMVHINNGRCILIPMPKILLSLVATLLGKRKVLSRLTDNLQIDVEDTKRMLNWTPAHSIEDGLKKIFEDNIG